jgi:hypothetical protein
MHAVIRSYSGQGAKELFDLIVTRKAEIETLIKGIRGVVSYSVVRTAGGGSTVTICQDKAGTDESVRVAKEWVQKNAANLKPAPPVLIEGAVDVHF